jgi:hypothetical protein
MEPGPYEKVPLLPEEKQLLLRIYDSRLRMFLGAYSGLTAIAFFLVVGPGYRALRTLDLLPLLGIILMVGAVPFAGIMATGIYLLRKRILPFKHDAISGVKEKVPFRVVRKEFDITGQYYVALDDPDYLHHELDEDTYNSCNVGDLVYLYRGARSNYIFEPDSRYTLM